MRIKQALLMALKSLKSSKMRSFLTMLGVIIGIASVIVLVSLMNGLSNSMAESFESMGTNLITVNVMGRGGNRTVKPEQMEEFVTEHGDLFAAVTPQVNVKLTMKYETENISTSGTGVSEAYPEVRNVELSSGRFLQYLDVERRQKVCVIGSYQAAELFAGEDPVGKTVRLNGDSFTVVGVLEEQQDSVEGSSDDTVLLPYSVATRLSGNATVSSYFLSAADKEVVDEAMATVESFLTAQLGSSDDYMVFSQAQALEQLNEMTGTITTVLVGIAAISLLVGGVGIMNIMLVSVTERTREIGIRKSLGGRRRDILSQFIIEAATTSMMGGALGILLGIGASYGAAYLMDMTASPSLTSILLAVGVSASIGIAFGYFPAAKAARLRPIEALRQD